MSLKKIVLAIILLFLLVISFLAGYFTLKYNDNITNKNDIKEPAVKSVLAKVPQVIQKNTRIIKSISSSNNNNEIAEIPENDVIGMTREEAEKYYYKKGFTIIHFSPEEIKLVEMIIGENTKIIKSINYCGVSNYHNETNEKSGSDVFGMNRQQAEQYYYKNGFTITDFSADTVKLTKSVKGWPPGSFIAKGENGNIVIYQVDSNGELTPKQYTDIKLSLIPLGDREELSKGKLCEIGDGETEKTRPCKTIDEVNEFLEEYRS